ncbi:MAG: hypothetical protein JSV88_31150, partial [Candidatus Aminicenantes bacterium]
MGKKKSRLGNNPLAWIKDTTKAAGVSDISEATEVTEVVEAEEIKTSSEINVDRKQRIEILNMVKQHRIDLEEGLKLIRQVGKRQGDSQDEVTEKSGLMYFREYWQECDIEPIEFTISQPQVLVILDSGEEFFHALGEYLGKRDLILVKPGEAYREIDNNIYEINARDLEDYRRLAANLRYRSLVPSHIVHWWSKERFSPRQEDINRQLDLGIYSLFYLTRVLLEQEPEDKVRLLYVYPIFSQEPQPQYEGSSGFVRTLCRENSRFRYKTLGIPEQLGRSFCGGV